ncbi:SNF-related serine/threonine-protein kinase-like [Uranotaenia lowii]|uniref:SNF-related serine/threonine-protein kinase-like n=1 Tax=Uranotaenia lowii TaxID=190385 RepID=UPI002479D818|nr:SNF-related serine/threonine-protein kinase-like [Uranotaenia lowii]XP_055601800.1 SNF-related serine/threonine-protein kinase-like [Uranotaenia lowii]XP_055601801.1 SNF-related serine/threonine-protein kinase-like [Uranotaenia lowii]XP_055601802.1 SNF-related serine/threonine-protein kinase-like [Uranotaenia lowii]XP_055601804.1 SNF-related serine/threonine-protein kinase-like [Uranotaenia lowii]XP_055601805.1 SNF-related serine/threonine-protein kinase-like [Uranotaenia lowii]XP_05560180
MQRNFGLSPASRAGVYDGKIAGLYDLEETLGSGHFAVVKLARHVFTGEKVAVKVIEKTKLDEISRAHLFQEVRCMKLVQHPHVVRLYEVIDTQTKLYLILELGDGGDLYDYIMRHDKGLSENLAQEYFRQIVRAISYCHQLHVVHRDLKPENVVFFEKLGVVKLTDFGFSNKFCPGQKLETSCGSLAYSAPEILLGDSYDAPAVDVWSLGVILYMLVCGHPPFQEANDSETLTMIMDCKYTMPDHVSEGCRQLIAAMLVREPEKRYTLQQIAEDPWLMEGAIEDTPEYLPLVSREQVSEEDHTLIIQKMINGKIATKEEILEALDRNEYNHITATYFLLAERKLRAHRQEEAQKRKPELTLPVSSAARLQDFRKDSEDDLKGDSLLPPKLGMLLSVPRTPGTETGQTGRNRKCSIVQEEEDDEDDGAAHEELSAQLNRRGSRSEGRINVTVQDRIAESERLKLEAKKQLAEAKEKELSEQLALEKIAKENKGSLFGGLGNVTLITSENSSTKDRLGIAGGGLQRKVPEIKRTGMDFSKKSSILKPSLAKMGEGNLRTGSFDKCIASIRDVEHVTTKIITDSSTITIPLPSLNVVTTSTIPKYKTMPSPTRANTILNATTNCLNEIFEEGTDVGSSDSTSTTPRPVVRNQFNARAQSQGSGNGSVVHRRTKFNKSRTASCSSSDASDDDSENRKKRAHKIVDSTVKPQTQRRDSHDDSSDSQDPGNSAAPSGGQTAGYMAATVMMTSASSSSNDNSSQPSSSDKRSSGGGNRQKTSQQVDFRRHRGRRRPVETRLRESQSLNRITEVQESEISHSAAAAAAAAAAATAGAISTSIVPNEIAVAKDNLNTTDQPEEASNVEDGASSSNPPVEEPTPTDATANASGNSNTNNPAISNPTKPKGFSARIFHPFKKQHHHNQQQQQQSSNSSTPAGDVPSSTGAAAPQGDDIEIVVELTKALNASESSNTKSTKKIKILGRYFQVHKKIYVPLSGLFQRGRLYKAQSCGSIVRDKVNVNPNGVTGCGGRGSHPSNARHSTIFNEKNRFIKNCLTGSRLLGSDGDINHNNGGNSFMTGAGSELSNGNSVGGSAGGLSNGSISPAELVTSSSPTPCSLAVANAGTTASLPIKTA